MSGALDVSPLNPYAIVSLNEHCLTGRLTLPVYALVKKEGPDNACTLTYSCTTDWGRTVGAGTTKKQASTIAADQMMKLMRAQRPETSTAAAARSPATAAVSPFGSVTASRMSPAPAVSQSPATGSCLKPSSNSINELGEYCQRKKLPFPEYSTARTEGPQHAPTFTVSCTMGYDMTEGTGVTLKDAKREAAAKMLSQKIPGRSVRAAELPDVRSASPVRQVVSPLERMLLTSPAHSSSSSGSVPLDANILVREKPDVLPVTALVQPVAQRTPAGDGTGDGEKRANADEDKVVFQFFEKAQQLREMDLFKALLDVIEYNDNEDGDFDANAALAEFCAAAGAEQRMTSRAVGPQHQSLLRIIRKGVVVAMGCGTSSRSQKQAESNAVKRTLISIAMRLD